MAIVFSHRDGVASLFLADRCYNKLIKMTDWFESLWESNEETTKGKTRLSAQDRLCGCTNSLATVQDESRNEQWTGPRSQSSQQRVNENEDEQRDIPADPASSIWENFWSSFREVDNDNDDDASVTSTSGMSLLSVDYDNVESIPGLEGDKKVDLSDIGDDESTVMSDDIKFKSGDTQGGSSQSLFEKRRSSQQDEPTSFLTIDKRKSSVSGSTPSHKAFESSSVPSPKDEETRKKLLVELRSTISSHGRYTIPVADMVLRLAEFHESVSQYETSLTLYQEALTIYSSNLGDHDPITSDVQIRLGRVKEILGHDDALELYFRALSMITAMSGAYHINASDVRLRVANFLLMKGNNKDAVKELKKALRGYRETYGDEHVAVADTVDKIATVYSHEGNNEKANSVRGELVKLRVALHGNKCIETADAIEKWADTHDAVGDHSGALRVMKQAYVLFHDVDGPNGKRTESSLQKIGLLYSQLGRGEKAVKAHTSVVVMRKKRYGEISPETAKSYHVLGKAFVDVKQFEKALKSFNRAMSSYGKENNISNDHISPMMETLHEIGNTYHKMGKHEQALKSFFKEHSIRKKLVQYDEIRIAQTLESIGTLYYDMSKYESGKNFFIESMQIYDR